ncbi:hypothetical protein [Pedobacter immunditicola]|uniref:hypothetical protein n=1 Tax=Pedobacter immunditicola TaxID=3133440 RepID=UPI0030B5D299
MKKIKLFYKRLLLVLLTISTASCLPDTQLGPEKVEGSVIRFQITNVEGAIVSMLGHQINVSLPIGATTNELIPQIIVAQGTTILDYTEGQTLDLSKDYILKVMGTNNVVVEYLVKTVVQKPKPGFAQIELLFEKKHSSFYGWTNNQQYSTATSGDHVLVANTGVIQVLNGNTGEPKGVLAGHPGAIHQIANDDAGRIFSVNVITTATAFKIHKWENVNSTAPELIINYTIPAGDWPSGGNLGRCLLSVTGDISKNAVICIPMVNKNYFYRWVYTNGQLVSNTPEKVTYNFPLATKTFGNITANVNPLGNMPVDGYVVTQTARGWEYIGKDKQYSFATTDGAIPYRSFVFNFNKAKYYAGSVATPNSAFYIFNITDPKAIELTESQRFDEGIDFKPFQSVVFPVETVGNTTPHIGFSFKQNADGTGILYYLYANSGLRAYKLTPNEN